MDVARQTISEDYRVEQQKLHGNKRYGVASLTYAPLVSKLLKIGNCRSLSDYGAGKCNLKVALGLRDGGPVTYQPYDPAFPDYGPPRPADLVTCIDVLEHIEPDLLDNVLDEIASITQRLAFLTIHTQPAKKVLSDGRNAHLIQEPPSWWIDRLSARFEILHLQAVPKGFFVIGGAKGGYAELTRSVDLEELGRVAGRARVRRKGLKRLLKALIGR
jgi:hypothetical protein